MAAPPPSGSGLARSAPAQAPARSRAAAWAVVLIAGRVRPRADRARCVAELLTRAIVHAQRRGLASDRPPRAELEAKGVEFRRRHVRHGCLPHGALCTDPDGNDAHAHSRYARRRGKA